MSVLSLFSSGLEDLSLSSGVDSGTGFDGYSHPRFIPGFEEGAGKDQQ